MKKKSKAAKEFKPIEANAEPGWIIGIDPSLTATGICCYPVHLPDEVYETHVIGSGPSHTLRERFNRYDYIVERIALLIEHIQDDLGHEILLIAIEGYSFGSRGAGTYDRAEFGGLLRQRLLAWPSVVEVPPAHLKKFTTGKGTADKPKMIAHIMSRWQLSPDLTEDEYEAFALAKLGACVCGSEVGATDFQRIAASETAKRL